MTNTIQLKYLVYEKAACKSLLANPIYKSRLDLELSIINVHECADYFLLYSRMMDICSEENIIKGPGCGRALGSLVNYVLGITGVDPIKHNLFLEPFFVRDPRYFSDIIIDVPPQQYATLLSALKSELQDYHVYRVATQSNNDEKALLNTPKQQEKIHIHDSRLYISKALDESKLMKIQGEQVLFQKRGKQNKDLDQFNIFPHPSLQVIYSIIDLIGSNYLPDSIPLNDPETFALFQSGDFSFIPLPMCDSKRLRSFAMHIQPRKIEDIAIMTMLFNTSVKDAKSEIRAYKQNHGIKAYSDERLDYILSETSGHIIYTETILRILHELAGMKDINSHIWLEKLKSKPDDVSLKDEFAQSIHNDLKANSQLTRNEIRGITSRILDSVDLVHLKSNVLGFAITTYWMVYYKTHFRDVYELVSPKI